MRNLILNLLLLINIAIVCSISLFSCQVKSEKHVFKKNINPNYDLIFSENSNKNITIDYYSISSHEEIVVIDNNYKEIGIIDGLRQNKFVDVSNNLDVIEILYSRDSTLLDTYILSIYKSYLYGSSDSSCKVTVCNENRYMASMRNVNKFFSDKSIESNMVFNYNNIIFPIRVYESDYIVVIVFIKKRKIIPIFIEGDNNIIKLSAYALKKEQGARNNIIIKELLGLTACKEKTIIIE